MRFNSAGKYNNSMYGYKRPLLENDITTLLHNNNRKKNLKKKTTTTTRSYIPFREILRLLTTDRYYYNDIVN